MNENIKSFIELGISEKISQKLVELDITTPTEIQQKVIPEILENKNVIFESETGTGKTFAYLLPLAKNLQSAEDKILIIAPTYELASQIKTNATKTLEQKASLFIGGTPIKRQIETLKEKPQIIIGNPSRLLELIHLKKLKTTQIKAVVLDEVDRLISSEIIDETRKLLDSISKNAQFVACSATLSDSTKRKLEEFFDIDCQIILPKEDVLKTKISHWAIFAESRDKISTLRSFLLAEKPQKALIFTSRADQVENIYTKLKFKNIECMALHSKSDKRDRKAAIDNFRNGKCRLLVTSDLASRGLDIQDVTHIIQMDLPSNEDFFIHRSGRTARAGKTGINVVIGDEYEMRKYAALEKKFGLKVFPKVLYKGKLVNPSDLNFEE